MKQELIDSLISRRDFIKLSAAGALSLALPGKELFGASAEGSTDVWVFHGKNDIKLMNRAMETIMANGGFGAKANRIALKVNAAWARTPAQGANTSPVLVDAFLKKALTSGVKEILVPEHPCRSAKKAFPMSGIQEVVEKHKQKMIALGGDPSQYRKIEIEDAKRLKIVGVAPEFLDVDAVVNMPVAKNHGSAKLTMAMKNWMGAVRNRAYWHANDLHQCIADFCTFMKPNWAIIDATRIMLTKGPQGPGKMKHPHLLVVSKDQVAADAYTSTLFLDSPYKVKYLRIARDMKIGQTDIAKMNVHKIEVAA